MRFDRLKKVNWFISCHRKVPSAITFLYLHFMALF
jgi:hypothetical protein